MKALLLFFYCSAAYAPEVTWRLEAVSFDRMKWTDAQIVTGYRWEHD